MTWRGSLLLALLGLGLAVAISRFQPFPGYLDSDYYFAGGLQLAEGKGFTEPYLWNYLDDPAGIPHPSHTYWMPFASIIAAGGMWPTGRLTYASGRLGFMLLAALVPPATAALAYAFSRRRDLAWVSGLLAVFSIYYAPFMPVPDNYGVYLLLGAIYLAAMSWRGNLSYVFLGLISGLLALARSDGILWLGLTLVLIVRRAVFGFPALDSQNSTTEKGSGSRSRRTIQTLIQFLLAAAGFILIMGAWYWRNYSAFGTLLAPGGGHLLWLKNYDETFAYPASQLTFGSWLAQGWQPIIAARLVALRWNLLNALAAQGGIFLAPFILVALWHYRKDERVQIGALGWLALLLVMTVVFPFAGYRGGFFHSGAALQSLWWVLAPLGLDLTIAAARRRGLFTPAAFRVFQSSLVGLAVLMTGVVIVIRVLPGWGEGEREYPRVQAFLQQSGIRPTDVVMVRNPPGYFLMTGQPAIVVPYSDADMMWVAATRYHARFVVLEQAGVTGPIKLVYDDLHSQHFVYLGELDGTRVFKVQP
jgi:hypothetical protein